MLSKVMYIDPHVLNMSCMESQLIIYRFYEATIVMI